MAESIIVQNGNEYKIKNGAVYINGQLVGDALNGSYNVKGEAVVLQRRAFKVGALWGAMVGVLSLFALLSYLGVLNV